MLDQTPYVSSTARRRTMSRRIVFLGCIYQLLSIPQSFGAEWYVEPLVTATYEVNDNRSLTTAPHRAVHGHILDAGIKTAVNTESSEWQLIPRIFVSRYSDSKNIDSNDYYVDGRYAYSSEREQVSISAGTSRNTTLTTQSTDIGLVDKNVPRRAWNAHPSWEYQLSERSTIGFDTAQEVVTYGGTTVTSLVDSTYRTTGVFTRYAMSERARLGVTLYGARLDAPEIQNISNDQGAQLTANYQSSETGTLSLRYGYRRTEYSLHSGLNLIQGASHGNVIGFTHRYDGERRGFNSAIERSINPNGFGFLVETRQVKLGFIEHYASRLTFTADVLAFRNRSLDARLISDDRDYMRLSGAANYQLTPWWSMGVTLNYTKQKFTYLPQAAQSRAVLFTLSYNGARWAGGNL